jgi:exopolyphosphatase/pppGpp-phosphohydrolase
VTATGTISQEKLEAALHTLQTYKDLATQHGATQTFVVATEAIRQASNSSAFIATIKEMTGLEVQLISGITEAALTFSGATYEAGKEEMVGVMDLGGGSLELVLAHKMHITWRTSLPVGSGWLHDQYLSANPPPSDELEAADTFLTTYFRKLHPPQSPPKLIVTGGSANSLLHLTHKAFHRPEEHHRLSREDLVRSQALLSALPAEDVAQFFGQPLARAKILLAGTLIIRHMMKRLKLKEIFVSSHGIREGVLLAYARYGDNWLAAVSSEKKPEPEESFVQSARQELVERLHTMLEWVDEVLKHEDIEAVHKMRVASRRLRATLDAYQSCCEPGAFVKVYRRIKRIANLLGEARDTDVMLHYLHEQLENLAADEQEGVRWLMTRLREYRQQKQQELDAFLRHLDGKKLEEALKDCVRERTKR